MKGTCQAHPGFDIEISLRFGGIVDYEDAAGPLVVDLAEGLVAFLACSVPEGHFDVLVPDLHNLGEELYADGGFLAFVELVADVPGGYVGFSRASRADDDYFKHLVVVLHQNDRLLLIY